MSIASMIIALSVAFFPLTFANCWTGTRAWSWRTLFHRVICGEVQSPYTRRIRTEPYFEASASISGRSSGDALSPSTRNAIGFWVKRRSSPSPSSERTSSRIAFVGAGGGAAGSVRAGIAASNPLRNMKYPPGVPDGAGLGRLPPHLRQQERDPSHAVEGPVVVREGVPELPLDLLGDRPHALAQDLRRRAPVHDGDEVVRALLDEDLTIAELEPLHFLVESPAERVLDEILDDLEHPHQDVLVLVLDEARGAMREEDPAVVHDEHVVDEELPAPATPDDEPSHDRHGRDDGDSDSRDHSNRERDGHDFREDRGAADRRYGTPLPVREVEQEPKVRRSGGSARAKPNADGQGGSRSQ